MEAVALHNVLAERAKSIVFTESHCISARGPFYFARLENVAVPRECIA